MLRANSIMFAARPGTGRSVKQLSRSRDSCRSGSINIYVRSHWWSRRHVVKFGAVQRVTVMPQRRGSAQYRMTGTPIASARISNDCCAGSPEGRYYLCILCFPRGYSLPARAVTLREHAALNLIAIPVAVRAGTKTSQSARVRRTHTL